MDDGITQPYRLARDTRIQGGGEWIVEESRQVKLVNGGLGRIGRGQESGIQNQNKKIPSKEEERNGGWDAVLSSGNFRVLRS